MAAFKSFDRKNFYVINQRYRQSLQFLRLCLLITFTLSSLCYIADGSGSRRIGRDVCPQSLTPKNQKSHSKHKSFNASSISFHAIVSAEYLQDSEPNTAIQSQKCLCYPGNYLESFDRTVKLICLGGNFADIHVALLAIDDHTKNSEEKIAIEELVIRSAPSMNRFFGPLLHGKTIRTFSVSNSNVSEISEDVFRDERLVGALASLNFASNSIKAIPDAILNFPSANNVTHLSLAHNQLTTIPQDSFKSLHKLVHLDLTSNRIKGLNSNSFNGLGSLESLLMGHNDLSKFERNLFKPIAKSLRVLDVSHNSFTKLGQSDLNDLGQLTSLNFSFNDLSSLPRSALARVSQLMHLDVAFNQFTSLDSYLLRSVRFLRSFNASHNHISELARGALKSVTRIKTIDLSHNSLNEIPPDVFINLSWLDELDLSFNAISHIRSGAFDRLFKFSLDLQSNNLSFIESGAFRSCANITNLNLYNNSIVYVGPHAFGGSDQDVSDVTQLDLSFNSLSSLSNFSVISNFTGLKVLNVSHNSITGRFDRRSAGFTSQNRLFEVHTIDMSYNSIQDISGHVFEKFASVRLINLTRNSLLRVGSSSFGNLPTLLTLDLSCNNISEISSGALVHLISLRELYLQDNKLTKMFAGLPFSLTYLQLDRNEIADISPGIFPTINSLLTLRLDNNRLVSLQAGALRNLRSLQSLTLSNNRIVEIPREALQDCSFSLQNISLRANKISLLDRQAFGQLPIVFHVDLQENEINDVRSLAFDGLLQLLSLNISHNRIQKLPNDVFTGLVSLLQLDLSFNNLVQLSDSARNNGPSGQTISPSPLEPLLSVRHIDLSHNHISSLNDHSLPKSPYIPYKLTTVNLTNNTIDVLGVTRYASNLVNGTLDQDLDKNEDYTVWLSDSCRCTCPALNTCIGYRKRATQVQPKCKLEFCSL